MLEGASVKDTSMMALACFDGSSAMAGDGGSLGRQHPGSGRHRGVRTPCRDPVGAQ